MSSSLNLFQKFVDESIVRAKMQLPNPMSAILDYSEYSIHMDFNIAEKNQYRAKNRKNQIPKEFTQAFSTLTREQKIQYYCNAVSYVRNMINNNFQPPKMMYSGILNTVGYSRSFNIKRWKQKKLRLDLDKHLMFAEREQKIKTYDMRNYILRKSKNKDYYCFVLEAINNIPPEKSMTVHIGFTEEATYNEWIKAIKYSGDYSQWQFYLQFYKNLGVQKSVSARHYTTDDIFYNKGQSDMKYVPERTNTMDLHQGQQMLSKSMVLFSNQKGKNDLQHYQIVSKDKVVGSGVPKPQNSSVSTDNNLKKQKQMKEANNNGQTQQKSEKLNEKIKEKSKLQDEIKTYQSQRQMGKNRKTMVDELIEGDVFEEPDVFEQKIEEENQQSKQSKRHLDLFHKLYPEYELQQLEIYANFQLLHEAQNFKVYQHTLLEKRLKLLVNFDKKRYNRQQVLSMLSKPETSGKYNDNIESSQLKTFIPSENSALMYQVNKPYNRLYRARDYVFIRHVFSQGSKLYMIDKSIQNTNYPPFLTIVRGSLCIVYGIFQRQDFIELIADFQVLNEGLLNPVQQTNLTLRYIKGYTKMSQSQIQVNSYKFFHLDWDISKNKANQIQNEIRSRRRTITQIQRNIQHTQEEIHIGPETENRNFAKKHPRNQLIGIKSNPMIPLPQVQVKNTPIKEYRRQQSSSNDQSPVRVQKFAQLSSSKSFSPSPQPSKLEPSSPKKLEIKRFDQNAMQLVGQINGQETRLKPISYLNVVRELNPQGMVIINKSYRTHKYLLDTLNESKPTLMEPYNGHPIWRGEWTHDSKEGGIIFIHKKKIEDQKGVLKFIISKIAKNIVSGQSITNISLPVDIFSAQSNLQRFLYSMSYAPMIFEGVLGVNLLNRLIKITIFGLSNSILYLSMQKPFNPILGETFQCWINGCPAYAQQISHHPPIGALMFKGRGYSITAQLESKVSLGVNSGTGTNEGIYRVKFDDKMEICFITPGGEISGLTAGDRKFNIVGKSYYWVTDTNIMLQIAFDPFKKGFFSIGKQQKPSDYFQGTIWEVKPEFMAKFVGGKRKQPEEKDRVRDLGKISGIWHKYICYNNKQIWNFDKQFPVVLEYEATPLPSDANWREDIEYRRRNQITRAQTEKERLEVLQRKDRKFREKYHKHK